MSELAKKFHLLKDGTVDDMTAYTTLEEVSGQGIKVKFDGIDGYIGYGTEGELSRLKYQKQENGQVYNVLKTAKPPSPVTLKAYRNDETFMQNLPSLNFEIGQTFYLNNENAPTIEGYDFVCCTNNNSIVAGDMEVKVYYIPQSVSDRTRTDWSFEYYQQDFSSGVPSDLCNTYNANDMSYMFANCTLPKLPKINTSNVAVFNGFLSSLINTTFGIDLGDIDTSNGINFSRFFNNSLINGDIIGYLDLRKCRNVNDMFTNSFVRKVHLKNVPRSLDFSNSEGTEGTHYIIDNYID